MGVTMGDSDFEKNLVTISLADYGRTRDEIDKRTALSAQLLNFEIILVAAMFSGFEKIPKEALIVVCCLSSVLWLMWIDHTSQIYKLAAYNELVVARTLRQRYPGVLAWEDYLRRLEDETQAGAALSVDPHRKQFRLLKTQNIGNYITLLFAFSSIALGLLYIQSFWIVPASGRAWAHVFGAGWFVDRPHSIGLAIALLVFAYAANASRKLKGACSLIGRAIQESASNAPQGVPQQ